jgi:hypothetical protein
MPSYYVQTDEIGDWVESYTVWGYDGSRTICNTLEDVEKVTGDDWCWVSLDDAVVHWTRQASWKGTTTVEAKFWDSHAHKHSVKKVTLRGSTPWYRPQLTAC